MLCFLSISFVYVTYTNFTQDSTKRAGKDRTAKQETLDKLLFD